MSPRQSQEPQPVATARRASGPAEPSFLRRAVPLALALVSQGVVQTFGSFEEVPLTRRGGEAGGDPAIEQVLPMGPAASQVAIKQLGTNGGGFFNANSAALAESTRQSLSYWYSSRLLLSGSIPSG